MTWLLVFGWLALPICSRLARRRSGAHYPPQKIQENLK